jgi:transposase InsO family protein
MDAKIRFVSEALEGIYSMAELCRSYDISRRTGYKWLGRYESEGPYGLSDRSKAPRNHPHAISEEVKQAVLSVKGRFSHWGPAKIQVRLKKEYPGWSCYPAVSTLGEYLKRQGLVCSRKRRRRASPTMLPLTVGSKSNDVWTADFKGYFRTGDGRRCNPLTISDDASRYLLCCRHLDRMSHELVQIQFERAFREYGLPLVIRTDNGEPFSSRGLSGLSRLSYWWIRLGIHPERIMPGHPEHNGRHERMHKTLKKHTANPPAKTIAAQQKRFDLFRVEYNDYRPHEALDMQTPTSRYSGSARCYPARLPEVYYPEHMKLCRVQHHGDIYYFGRRFFVTECLSGEYVGVEQIEQDWSRLWYCNYELGTVDHRKWQVIPAKCRALLAGVNPSKQES